MNITLKNVPVKVHRALKRAAKEQGRSLNAQIIQTLELEAAHLERRRKLPQLIEKLNRFAASLPPMDDSAPLIRQERQRR
ncbi:MAG: FitA-like ribbon-helix-helix domain-containing protein [Bryobacteraceae bacterium]